MEVSKANGSGLSLDGLNPYYNGRYSWRQEVTPGFVANPNVLILIIMEDTHGVFGLLVLVIAILVLILIIMEDTHGGNNN